MTKRIWHKGAPPSIGWWPASNSREHRAIRWWDGNTWSGYARPWFSAEQAALFANLPSYDDGSIEWCQRWWE